MATSNINIVFRIFARNPPSIAIAGGILLILFGGTLDYPQMMDYGWSAIIIGFLLQLLWIFMISTKRGR